MGVSAAGVVAVSGVFALERFGILTMNTILWHLFDDGWKEGRTKSWQWLADYATPFLTLVLIAFWTRFWTFYPTSRHCFHTVTNSLQDLHFALVKRQKEDAPYLGRTGDLPI